VKVHPAAKAALIAGLDHPNAKVRWWCLQLMDHLADESYLEPILSKLSDPVAKVRRHAVHGLSCGACKPNRRSLKIDIESALRTLLETDPNEKVREEVRQGLARLCHVLPSMPANPAMNPTGVRQTRCADTTLRWCQEERQDPGGDRPLRDGAGRATASGSEPASLAPPVTRFRWTSRTFIPMASSGLPGRPHHAS